MIQVISVAPPECPIRLALRVVSAFAFYEPVRSDDAQQLQLLAESDDERTLPLDDLARIVVSREIERNRRG